MKSFEELTVWQKAHRLALRIYRVTKEYPADEKFGLISQMRRAAVSVPANIAEGFKKRGIKDKAHFYNISQGSLEELRYYVILSKELGYISKTEEINSNINEVARLITAFIKGIPEKHISH